MSGVRRTSTSAASMTKELRRTSIVVLAMIAALFVSTSIIQVVDNDALAGDPRNSRTFYADNSVNRGPILVEGKPIAYSKPSADGDPIAYQRYYTDGKLYAPVTGYLTIGQGNTGLEAAMNDYLTGKNGGQFLDQLNAVLTGQQPAGAAVETTIEAKAQKAAYKALGKHKGAAIAIDPDTGKILALVSTPSFDPNALAVHDTSKVIKTYNSLLKSSKTPLIDRAMNGDLDPPGSTFKLVVASAALESGSYTSDSAFSNTAALQLPGTNSVIHNITRTSCGPGKKATIFDAIRLSCNIPFAELGQALTYKPILQMAEAYGFNQSIDIAGGTGMTSTPSAYPHFYDVPQTMLSAFGQASDLASPLQMAMVSMAIANGGTIMQPDLVDSVVGSDQSTLVSFEPKSYGQPISSTTASALTDMMVASVANGAASGARIPGLTVAGKTGTAEKGDGQPNTVWFTGFAPADDPQVVVAVVVQGVTGDATGSAVAAPIAKAIFQAVISK